MNGSRYIDDYGSTLDVHLVPTTSSILAISLPPVKDQPSRKKQTRIRHSRRRITVSAIPSKYLMTLVLVLVKRKLRRLGTET